MRYIFIALSFMLLFSGCTEKGETETATIQAINSNPTDYLEKTVEVKGATVNDVAFLQQGLLLIRMSDSSGSQMVGLYSGDLYLVNVGDAATFEGVIKSEAAYGGAHLGSPQIMEITGIRDVDMGGGVATVPTQPVLPDNPTIAQIIANANFLVDQVVSISGTVLAVKHIEQHTETPISYIQVDDGSGQIWVSLPKIDVAEGSQVTLSGAFSLAFGDPMILAETLNVVTSGSGSPHGDTPITVPTTPTVEAGEIAKVEGGYTIEELFAQKESLAGQEVKVRAKVMKTSLEPIMGSYWFHIQDGTGNPAQKTDDMTVTYSGNPALNSGDVVVITATLSANKDFGAGYAYDAILEGATIEK